MPDIHQLTDWPNFHWNHEELLGRLGAVRHLQGTLLGKMSALAFDLPGILGGEMSDFIECFNQEGQLDPVIKTPAPDDQYTIRRL